MTPLEFLKLVWQHKHPSHYILSWSRDDKQSYWFQDIAGAANFVQSAHGRDVYVGVGVAGREYGPKLRCDSVEIAGIPGYWADFDLKSEAHHQKSLPATIEAALSIIPPDLPPTIIIATGNGVHAWWLFKEPWIFESNDERKEASSLSVRFQTLLLYKSSQHGWAFDRLSDFARVLRMPGTINAKDPNNPKEVEVYAVEGRRFNPSDLREYLDDLAITDMEADGQATQDWAKRFADNPLIINLNARIPQETLDRWLAGDSRFKKTWFRQREELGDQSQSGYDMALACFGAGIGLRDQQIVDLIIHHRSMHRQKPRTGLDYFHRTISKADQEGWCLPVPSGVRMQIGRHSIEMISPIGAPEDSSGDSGVPNAPSDPAIAKAQLCDRLSNTFGVRILRLVKISGKEPLFRMELESGKIEFTSIGKLLGQQSLRMAIAAETNQYLKKQKSKIWEEIAQLMLDALTEVDGGEEMQLEVPPACTSHGIFQIQERCFRHSKDSEARVPVGQCCTRARSRCVPAICCCTSTSQRPRTLHCRSSRVCSRFWEGRPSGFAANFPNRGGGACQLKSLIPPSTQANRRVMTARAMNENATGTLDGIGRQDHSLTSEYRIYGPPGTGKTTNLSSLILRAVEENGPASPLVTSFSRTAAAKLAGHNLPIHPDRIGTLHSHCFHTLDKPPIAEAHANEWNRLNPHLAITPVRGRARLEGEEAIEEDGERTHRPGNFLLQQLNRCRGLMLDRNAWPSDIRDFERKWSRYKQERGLLDFCDLIEVCLRDVGIAPGRPTVVFADEAQDLNPMQLSLLRKWGERADYFVLAGDDDQTIYSFTGAVPEAILDPDIPDDHKVVLKQSYRVPTSVHQFANDLIHQVNRRQEKLYLPRPMRGAVHRLSGTCKSPEYDILATARRHLERGKTVMFLASCSYMLHPLVAAFRAHGIPFHNPLRKANGFWNPLHMGRHTTTRRMLSLLAAHPRYGDGQRPWTYGDVALWVEFLRRDAVKGGSNELLRSADPRQVVTTERLAEILHSGAPASLLAALASDFKALVDWWRSHVSPEFQDTIRFPLEVVARSRPVHTLQRTRSHGGHDPFRQGRRGRRGLPLPGFEPSRRQQVPALRTITRFCDSSVLRGRDSRSGNLVHLPTTQLYGDRHLNV